MIATKINAYNVYLDGKKLVEVNGMEFVLYGRLDTLKAGTIYDIKFSGSYDKGKYVDSTQHPTYMELIPEADQFTYVVSNGQNVWTETYRDSFTRTVMTAGLRRKSPKASMPQHTWTPERSVFHALSK